MKQKFCLSPSGLIAGIKVQLKSKNGLLFSVLAFLIPLLVRDVPEILSWPYPIGFDTIRYVSLIQNNWVFSVGIAGFLKDSNLFYLVAAFPYALSSNAILVVKFMGPPLFAASCFMMFLYSTKVLGWTGWKSLLVVILLSTYFVSLRNSWDLYRQTLGLIFLMATFVSLKTLSSPKRYFAASVFMVLTILSHEFLAVLLFFILGVEAIGLAIKKSGKELTLLASSMAAPALLFVFQRFSHQAILPSFNIASGPSVNLSEYIFGLLLYMYLLVLPLILLGLTRLKDSILRLWIILCLGIVLLTILMPSVSPPYWNRWELLLVYPFVFFAIEGVDRLWSNHSISKKRLQRLFQKASVIVILFSILTLSWFYLTSTPENAFSYFSQYNPYLIHVPSSMLQTTIASCDSPSLVNCLQWLNENTNETSIIVSHYALYDWANIYIHNREIVCTADFGPLPTQTQDESALAESMLYLARNAFLSGIKAYTVWWVNGKGWYQIPSLPSDFREVHVAGNMAVYLYVPQAR